MTMTEELPIPQDKLEGREKFAVEFGPVVALFAGYLFNERVGPALDRLFGSDLFAGDGGQLFTGLALFLPAFAIAFLYSVIRTKRVAPVLAVTGAMALGMGILTFVFQDKRFFYIKPTIVYGLIALILTVGVATKKNFLKLLFDGAIELSEAAWRTLTIRIIGFHVVAALANEILWRTLTTGCVTGADCGGEAVWLTVKSIGFPIAYVLFMVAQAPLIMKDQDLETQGE
ncbi:MAG: septation protein IspZ [Pseudomonadota bacterium]